MFIGPLFWKEILDGLKRRRAYLFRGVYVGVLFVMLLAVWPGTTELAAASGERLIKLLFWVQFVMVAVITPVLTATTITAEKQAGSLDLLLLTRFRCSEVILGKFLSRAVQLEMLLLCALPIFSLAINIGGVDLRTILAGFAVIIVLVLLCGMAGIWCAIHAQRIHGAALASYLVIAVMLYPVPYGLERVTSPRPAGAARLASDPRGEGDEARQASHWSPPLAMNQILDPSLGMDVSWLWVRPALLCGVAAVLLFLGSVWSLPHATRKGPATAGPTLQAMWRALAAVRNTVAGGADLDRQIESGNPVVWREIRMRTLPNSIATMIAYLAALLAVGLVAFAGYSQGVRGLALHGRLALAANGALAIAASALAATALVREKEGRTMQALLTSLLTAREIVQGKEEGLRRCLRLGVLVLILYVGLLAGLAALDGRAGGRQVMRVDWVVGLATVTMGFFCVRFYIVQALYLSMRSRSTAFALVIALLCTVIELFVGSFVPLVAFLNPVGCGLTWSVHEWAPVVLLIGLGVSYLLYRWIVTQWLHKMLVVFQASVQEER